MFIHGDNLKQKLNHKTKYRDDEAKKFLQEIKKRYEKWRADNLNLKGPFSKPTVGDTNLIQQRTELLHDYKKIIDQQHYAEKFDSRSNLHCVVQSSEKEELDEIGN